MSSSTAEEENDGAGDLDVEARHYFLSWIHFDSYSVKQTNQTRFELMGLWTAKPGSESKRPPMFMRRFPDNLENHKIIFQTIIKIKIQY